MAPQKFGSMRHKSRPTAMRLAPFRDDAGLVALRYEETKQAEPPIPIPPPRNPRRLLNRSPSTTTSPSLIVVNPPPIPPPQEEHPLFRTGALPQIEERKRDSGAPTSSSVTLREDGAEDPLYQKLLADIADAPSSSSADEQSPQLSPAIDSPFAPPPLRLSISHRTGESASEVTSPTQPDPQASPTPQIPLTRKLSKTFTIKSSSGSKRLRKKMLGGDKVASQDAPPVTERGSPKSPKRPKSPKSLKSPKSPELPPHSTGFPSHEGEQDSERSESFAPITTPIPEDSLWDELGNLSFSTRGSIMFGGKSKSPFNLLMMSTTTTPAPGTVAAPEEQAASTSHDLTDPKPDTAITNHADAITEKPRAAAHVDSLSVPSIRVSSIDVERESQKVRSLYESGDDLMWEDGAPVSFAERLAPTQEVPSEEEENVVSCRQSDPPSGPPSTLPPGDHLTSLTRALAITPRSANSLSPQRDSQVRREYECAGGIEDWEDLEGASVDRYGFISNKRPVSRAGSAAELKSSQFAPRRRNVLVKRPVTAYSSSAPGGGFMRPPSRKVSARSLNTYTSELSTVSRRSTRSSLRAAANRLPHNRDRRWMDEAGEMLSLQAGLTGITDDDKTGKTIEAQKRKEAERSEKWRKMATVVKAEKGAQSLGQAQGQGMSYEFDTKSTKLIERTWKGIPDCWRSAAWYSFLASSAKAWNSSETDERLIAEFKRLQNVASPDDVQIDLDVPRTVNGHIMFRRRYRGGQRLLFRVLHAISLYFPETGYVQGMASLAATLLCYFDEERCFVMLVRLWRYRGLEYLYQPEFAGLMAALEDLETRWLAGKDVASKLKELSIPVTAYGIRWYLTLFNLSIPFPAQLRVWDVFMLMGECPPDLSDSTTEAEKEKGKSKEVTGDSNLARSLKGLDILHATSAALIHALRDVLLDSDFENAMKALTAWIPIKDEDLLMKVARAEWRRHQGRRAAKDKDKDK
ncbi:RabGAP/TBC [Canariomyces notabilis]|uniref:RabGAP/TBC n=1 Tax=Canariomyces notabilis TaxID=2074819 RepID=A0AAN6TBE5_9PEZI|nr:RabGAP/TBC [Canariomyces arenarius]